LETTTTTMCLKFVDARQPHIHLGIHLLFARLGAGLMALAGVWILVGYLCVTATGVDSDTPTTLYPPLFSTAFMYNMPGGWGSAGCDLGTPMIVSSVLMPHLVMVMVMPVLCG
jgi:hypothetical protein